MHNACGLTSLLSSYICLTFFLSSDPIPPHSTMSTTGNIETAQEFDERVAQTQSGAAEVQDFVLKCVLRSITTELS